MHWLFVDLHSCMGACYGGGDQDFVLCGSNGTKLNGKVR